MDESEVAAPACLVVPSIHSPEQGQADKKIPLGPTERGSITARHDFCTRTGFITMYA